MSNLPVDRNSDYMYSMWGTNKLVSDYGSLKDVNLIREVNFDADTKKHNFKYQNDIHLSIRNDEDYDDWNYGTEPIIGSKP